MKKLLIIKFSIFTLVINSLYATENNYRCEEIKSYLNRINDEVDRFDAVIKEHVFIFSTEVAMYSREISKEIEEKINTDYLDRKKVISHVDDIQTKVERDLLEAIKQRNAYDRYLYYSLCTVLTPFISLMAYDDENFEERELGRNVLNDEMIAMVPIKKAVLGSCLAVFPVIGFLYDKKSHNERLLRNDYLKMLKATEGQKTFNIYIALEKWIKRNPGKVFGTVTLGSALIFGLPYSVAHFYQNEDVEQEQENVDGIRSTIRRHMNTLSKFYNTYYFHLDLQKQVFEDYQINCQNSEKTKA
ncbi:MAG: hypothetical protein H6622_14380 [Halobacteriovoraceae bacterium]|nr:hypothetical protein [Halobacteriovoraceae bacterium]